MQDSFVSPTHGSPSQLGSTTETVYDTQTVYKTLLQSRKDNYSLQKTTTVYKRQLQSIKDSYLSTLDGAMDQCFDTGPQGSPTPTPPSRPQTIPTDPVHLQAALERVQGKNSCLNEQLDNTWQEKCNWGYQRKRFCLRIHKLNSDRDRLEGLLELREREFTAEHHKNYETIISCKSQISSLQKRLQSQTEQVDSIQNLNNQEKEKMAASLDAKKQKVSEQNNEIFTLRLENQHTAVLQNELQNKVNQLEQQLRERDKVILDLRKMNDSLSSRLLETTKNLRSHGPEFLE